MKPLGMLAGILCLGVAAFAADDNGNGQDPEKAGQNSGKAIFETRNYTPAGSNAASLAFARVIPITYHGGPVILGTTNVYYIWYGTWDASSISILSNLAHSIGGSPYFNINTTYYSGSATNPQKVSNSVGLAGTITTGYTYGKSLSDANILSIVSGAITSGALPKDSNAVYFVLTASDVNESSGFCTQYCGWHDHATVAGADIKYAFVGNAARCLSACAAQSTSPNGNPGADAMASVIAHELEEAVTDPDLNAWYDSRGYENADKCAWTFGATSAAANGSRYNMTLGGKQYLIQQNWVQVPNGGSCALSH